MRIFIQICFALSISLAIEGFCAMEGEVEETSVSYSPPADVSFSKNNKPTFFSNGLSLPIIHSGSFSAYVEGDFICLSDSSSENNKPTLSEVLAKMTPENREIFETAFTRLAHDIPERHHPTLLESLSKVSIEQMERFADIAQDLTQGMGVHKVWAILALTKVPPARLTDHFKEVAIHFIQNTIEPEKVQVLGALVDVALERLTNEFEVFVNRPTPGMEWQQAWVIRALAKIEHLDTLFHQFMDPIMRQQLQSFVPKYAQADLICRLSTMQPEQYQAEITRTINEGRFNTIVNRLTENMNSFNKAEAIRALSKVEPGQMENFEAAVNRFTQGMYRDEKTWVIQALAEVSPDHLTDEFEADVNRFSEGMDGYHKSLVISALSKVEPGQMENFKTTVNRFTQGMYKNEKTWVIQALAARTAEESFQTTVNCLAQGIVGRSNTAVIKAFAEIVPERLTNEFGAAADRLAQWMCEMDKLRVIEALGEVSPERLTNKFEADVNRFAQGMGGFNKAKVIRALAKIKPEQVENFEIAVNRFAQGMDVDNKAVVIKALTEVAPEDIESFEAAVNHFAQSMEAFRAWVINALAKVTPEHMENFKTAVNRLTQGIYGFYKLWVIESLAKMAPERLDLFMQQFTDSIVQQLHTVVPMNEQVSLIRRLAPMQPERYQAEIIRVIDSYKTETKISADAFPSSATPIELSPELKPSADENRAA